MTIAHINKIATAVPANDVHDVFAHFARSLLRDDRSRMIFDRMLQKSGIEHRWSCQVPSKTRDHTTVSGKAFLLQGNSVSTAARMRVYEQDAPVLAAQALEALHLGEEVHDVTHLVIASCTGFSAPGLDLQLIERFGLSSSVERTIIGFMGCYAAINALKLARHIVRSQPRAKVIVLCVELCSLHFHQTSEIDQVLMYLLFGDGCAATLVSAEPSGLALDSFHSSVIPGTADLMSWHIRDHGFDMVLSGDVPRSVYRGLRSNSDNILGGASVEEFTMWAVHPGGRTVLDAVESAFGLTRDQLSHSRSVLREYGNMSSPTILFVLQRFLDDRRSNQRGCGMSFGPGLSAETVLFRTA